MRSICVSTHTGVSIRLSNFLKCSESCFQRDSKSAIEFCTPGMCEKIKSMYNIAAINHRFLAQVASVVSLALPYSGH